jgi:hypothetical protein
MLTPDDIALKRRQIATLRARPEPSPEAAAAVARLEAEIGRAALSPDPDLHSLLAAALSDRDAARARVAELEAANDALRAQLKAKPAKPATKKD